MVASPQDFKILVADDSLLYRKLVEETLAHEHYAVCFAKNGREASDLLAEQRPALVITDWEMPDITGIELCGQIRSEQGSYTYIILLTSNTDKDQIIKRASRWCRRLSHQALSLRRAACSCGCGTSHRRTPSRDSRQEPIVTRAGAYRPSYRSPKPESD